MESHPPTRHSKKTVCDTRLTKCIFVPKMHFTSIYLLQKALLESPLWSKCAHFGRVLPYYGSKNSRKLLGKPQNQLTMRQNHPKMGFGGILDRLEAISIPSISISKGIKNTNFDRFWTTRRRPLSPDWLATCPAEWLATCPPP